MYEIKELQEMLGIQFSDDDAVDALRQHEMACYVSAHPEVILMAAKESKNMSQFYSTLRRHISSAMEKFSVSLEISQRMQSILCDMVYAHKKGVHVEVADAMSKGEDYCTMLFG